MRTFTEDEVQDMVTEAFDKGALHGVSWGKMAELPHLGKRRAIATNTCLDIFIKAIRNQDNGWL